MKITYHPAVQTDINHALEYYRTISDKLEDEFWDELQEALESAKKNPKASHFADGGLRRSNLSRFPYHFLYEILEGRIRVVVVRHHKRSPAFGLNRKR